MIFLVMKSKILVLYWCLSGHGIENQRMCFKGRCVISKSVIVIGINMWKKDICKSNTRIDWYVFWNILSLSVGVQGTTFDNKEDIKRDSSSVFILGPTDIPSFLHRIIVCILYRYRQEMAGDNRLTKTYGKSMSIGIIYYLKWVKKYQLLTILTQYCYVYFMIPNFKMMVILQKEWQYTLR